MSRVALVTGGMGGLGEAVCIKMAALGYKVVTTYSPSNTKAGDWLKQMKAQGAWLVPTMVVSQPGALEFYKKIGSPGAGKAMPAARLPAILPPLSPSELLEVSMIASVARAISNSPATSPTSSTSTMPMRLRRRASRAVTSCRRSPISPVPRRV